MNLTDCERVLYCSIGNYCIDNGLSSDLFNLTEYDKSKLITKLLTELKNRNIGIIPFLDVEIWLDDDFRNKHIQLSSKKEKEYFKVFKETRIIEDFLK